MTRIVYYQKEEEELDIEEDEVEHFQIGNRWLWLIGLIALALFLVWNWMPSSREYDHHPDVDEKSAWYNDPNVYDQQFANIPQPNVYNLTDAQKEQFGEFMRNDHLQWVFDNVKPSNFWNSQDAQYLRGLNDQQFGKEIITRAENAFDAFQERETLFSQLFSDPYNQGLNKRIDDLNEIVGLANPELLRQVALEKNLAI